MQHAYNFEAHGFTFCEFPNTEIELVHKAYKRVLPLIHGEYNLNSPPWGIHKSTDLTSLIRISQPHLCDSFFRALVCNSSLGKLVAKVTNSKSIRVWGSQLYFKNNTAAQSAVVGWHRDLEHMPFFKNGSVTVWLPLVNTHEKNGTLNYVPGSHKWKSNLVHTGAQIQAWQQQNASLSEQANSNQNNWDIVQLNLQIGQFSIHHCSTLHGSGPNLSRFSRPALAIGLLLDEYEIDNTASDYGFASALDDPYLTPLIYSNEV